MFAQIFGEKVPISESVRSRIFSDVRCFLEPVSPVVAIVFGSFADNTAHSDSDIDVLVVCRDDDHLKKARSIIYDNLRAPLAVIPVDLIFVNITEFQERRKLGGVCMIASESGIPLIGQMP